MTLRIFACPECRCKKFVSINALNVHLSRSHTLNYKVVLNAKGKGFKKRKRTKTTRAKLVMLTPIQKRA
jgi:hypothetical protein